MHVEDGCGFFSLVVERLLADDVLVHLHELDLIVQTLLLAAQSLNLLLELARGRERLGRVGLWAATSRNSRSDE